MPLSNLSAANNSNLEDPEARRRRIALLPLHCKGAHMHLPFGDMNALCEMPSADSKIQAECRHQLGWLNDPSRYDCIPVRSKAPFASVSTADIKLSEKANLIREIHDPSLIKGPVLFFSVPEKDDTRRRAIKHPKLANEHIGKESISAEMSIAGKRSIIEFVSDPDNKFYAQFDGCAWFDQFRLDDQIAKRFCFRKGRKYYEAVSLLMGLRISPQVGQAAMRQITNVPGNRTKRLSCIDNGLLGGKTADDVLSDLVECGARAAACGFTLNEAAVIANDPASMIATSGTYGGICFDLNTKETWLPDRILAKIRTSWAAVLNWNVRGFCVHMGLLLWSVDIIDVPKADYFAVFRFMSRISMQMEAAGHTAEAYAGPIAIWPTAMDALSAWTALCLENKRKHQTVRPTRAEADWLVATDACRDGFGYVALNQNTGEVRTYGSKWPREFRAMHYDKLGRSVFTEPYGVYMSMCHLLNNTGKKQHIVIGTDNVATEVSYDKGYNAHSYWLNEAVRRLYNTYPNDTFSFEMAYLPGIDNTKLADPLSRYGSTSETDGDIAMRLRQTLGGAAQGEQRPADAAATRETARVG